MSGDKDKYYDISEAYGELVYGSIGKKEKAMAAVKLIGKGLFNTAKFVVVDAIPQMKQELEKRKS